MVSILEAMGIMPNVDSQTMINKHDLGSIGCVKAADVQHQIVDLFSYLAATVS